MLSKCYESTEVDRRTWLHGPSGTPWSTSTGTAYMGFSLKISNCLLQKPVGRTSEIYFSCGRHIANLSTTL